MKGRYSCQGCQGYENRRIYDKIKEGQNMGWSLFSWLFGEKEESPPEQLVLGAELKCAYGTEHNFLIVQSDDMDINGLPEACVLDREKSVNIMSFGYCAFAFAACSMIMELEEQWENEEPQKMLSNGEEVITTKSTLLCKGCGGRDKGGHVRAGWSGGGKNSERNRTDPWDGRKISWPFRHSDRTI